LQPPSTYSTAANVAARGEDRRHQPVLRALHRHHRQMGSVTACRMPTAQPRAKLFSRQIN